MKSVCPFDKDDYSWKSCKQVTVHIKPAGQGIKATECRGIERGGFRSEARGFTMNLVGFWPKRTAPFPTSGMRRTRGSWPGVRVTPSPRTSITIVPLR
jgi:hypothetical protein